MSFINPSLLWAFAALAIPIGIHLLSRAEGRVIRVGSIRHFEESPTSRFKSIRPNELLLLLLRCAMISLLVLFLSGAQCTSFTNSMPRWVLVEKGLEKDERLAARLDSLVTEGYDLRYLTEGFPHLGMSENQPIENYRYLVSKLQSESVEDIIVFSRSYSQSFGGKRTQLPENIRWITIANEGEHQFIQQGYLSGENVDLIVGKSTSDKTYFEKIKMKGVEFESKFGSDSLQLAHYDTISVIINAAKEFEYDKHILVLAFRALEDETSSIIVVTPESNSADADWIFSLGTSPSAKCLSCRKVRLSVTNSLNLFDREDSTSWKLTKRLNEEVALKHHLVLELRKLMLPPTMVRKDNDRRSIQESLAWANGNQPEGTVLAEANSTSLAKYLIGLFLLVWIAERLLAYRRNL